MTHPMPQKEAASAYGAYGFARHRRWPVFARSAWPHRAQTNRSPARASGAAGWVTSRHAFRRDTEPRPNVAPPSQSALRASPLGLPPPTQIHQAPYSSLKGGQRSVRNPEWTLLKTQSANPWARRFSASIADTPLRISGAETNGPCARAANTARSASASAASASVFCRTSSSPCCTTALRLGNCPASTSPRAKASVLSRSEIEVFTVISASRTHGSTKSYRKASP